MSEIQTIKIKNPVTGEQVYPETSWANIVNHPEIMPAGSIVTNISNTSGYVVNTLNNVTFGDNKVYTIPSGDVTTTDLESGVNKIVANTVNVTGELNVMCTLNATGHTVQASYINCSSGNIGTLYDVDYADIDSIETQSIEASEDVKVFVDSLNSYYSTANLMKDVYTEDTGIFAKLNELENYVKYLANLHNVAIAEDFTVVDDITGETMSLAAVDDEGNKQTLIIEDNGYANSTN